MIKLQSLLVEGDWATEQIAAQKEVDLSKEEFEVSEGGFAYIRGEIDKLNKKATKYGVPPIELKVIKEVYKKVYTHNDLRRIVGMDDTTKKPEEKENIVKYYLIKLDGKPPVVEGFEFIAKIEHTPAGNILNFNPHASVKNLPPEYRTATQKCDVCLTNRDRNNTFILKLEKEDLKRFPNKKAGDFIMAGSACLKRFLPPRDLNMLISYAQFLEDIRKALSGDQEGDNDPMGDGDSGSSYLQTSGLDHALSAVYSHMGKYISKKKAREVFDTTGQSMDSTADVVSRFVNRYSENRKHWLKTVEDVSDKLESDSTFKSKVDALTKEFEEWKSKKDFSEEEKKNPNFADFFHNMSVMSKSDMVSHSKISMYSALFGMFLRDKGEFEKIAAKAQAKPKEYVGKVGEKITSKVTIKSHKGFDTQYGYAYRYVMETPEGNILAWFTSTDLGLEDGAVINITGTVKSQEPNKYTKVPETNLTRAKVLP